MKNIKNFINIGILFLLTFLAGCASSATTSQPSGVLQMVGPTPTPLPHTIIGTWKVDYDNHVGTVKFKYGGYVDINVSGYPGMSITYMDKGNNIYYISYFIYSVQFQYNPESDTITSDQCPGLKLTRLT